jgi:hypothetical protein
MGALLIKLLAPQFQTILIDAAQALQFQTDIAMQAFVRSVVLGMPGAASLQNDAQGYPPNREPAEPVHRTPTGKGTAIVTADGLRQSIALKEALKTLLHCLAACILQSSQLQEVTTVLITYRQRFAPLQPPVPLAPKIDCPHLVGLLGFAATEQPPALTRQAHPANGRNFSLAKQVICERFRVVYQRPG